MAAPRRDMDEERRRLLRRMEWVYVYAPPLLAIFVAVFGSAFLAWAVSIPGTTFLSRWAIGVAVLLGLPTAVYLIRSRMNKDDEQDDGRR